MPWNGHHLRRIRQSVLPVQGPHGPIGTGTVIAEGVALTALHVVAPEPPGRLGFGHSSHLGRGLPVRATATLPLSGYGVDSDLARRSQRRAHLLSGVDDGTVDLALLAVPGLCAPALPIRATRPRRGEHVMVPGYPGGRWNITCGPVSGYDEADFTVHLLLGPGASGAPVIDEKGWLTGLVTLDHEAGTICVGPRLVSAFVTQLRADFLRRRPGKIQES